MLTSVEKVLLLHEIDLFGGASTECLGQLAVFCHEMELAKDELLFRQGSEARSLFILVGGRMKLVGPGGETRIVEMTCLNPWAFFSAKKHAGQAVALDSCLVFEVAGDDIADIFLAEPELCLSTLRGLAREAHQTPPDA